LIESEGSDATTSTNGKSDSCHVVGLQPASNAFSTDIFMGHGLPFLNFVKPEELLNSESEAIPPRITEP